MAALESWQGVDKRRLDLVTTMTAVLSLTGSVAVIVMYAFCKSYHSQAAKVTCYLAVADLITIVAKVIGQAGPNAGTESVLCQTQGALIFWGDLSSCLWVSIIGMNLLLILYLNRGVADLRRYEPYYVLVGFGIPLLFAVPPLFVRDPPMYASAGLWCWISYEYKFWRICLFFLPLWGRWWRFSLKLGGPIAPMLCKPRHLAVLTRSFLGDAPDVAVIFGFNVGVYVISGRIIWKRSAVSRMLDCGSSALVTYRRIYARNASVYIAAFILAWGPSTINRAYQTIVGQKLFELSMLQALTSPLRGLLHFVAFFYVTFYLGRRDRSDAGKSTTKWPSSASPRPRSLATLTLSPAGSVV